MSVVDAGSPVFLPRDSSSLVRALSALSMQCSVRALERAEVDLVDVLRETPPEDRPEIREAILALRTFRAVRELS